MATTVRLMCVCTHVSVHCASKISCYTVWRHWIKVDLMAFLTKYLFAPTPYCNFPHSFFSKTASPATFSRSAWFNHSRASPLMFWSHPCSSFDFMLGFTVLLENKSSKKLQRSCGLHQGCCFFSGSSCILLHSFTFTSLQSPSAEKHPHNVFDQSHKTSH